MDIENGQVYLDTFFIYAQFTKYNATERVFKGIGKRLLCILLEKLLSKRYITLDTKIKVHAQSMNSCRDRTPIQQ